MWKYQCFNSHPAIVPMLSSHGFSKNLTFFESGVEIRHGGEVVLYTAKNVAISHMHYQDAKKIMSTPYQDARSNDLLLLQLLPYKAKYSIF